MNYVYWIDTFIGGRISPKHIPFENKNGEILSILCLEEKVPAGIIGDSRIIVFHHYFPKIQPASQSDAIDVARAIINETDRIISCCIKTERLIIHCGKGNDRTGLALLSYLVRIKKMTYQSGLELLRNINPNALSYSGFQDLSYQILG
jgi:hypothetical protein